MPEPMRTSTRPSTSSAINASRTDGLDTPSCRARSRSGGSRCPAVYSPERTSERIWSAICRYSRRGSILWMGMVEGRAVFAGAMRAGSLRACVAKQNTPIWSSGLTNFAARFAKMSAYMMKGIA